MPSLLFSENKKKKKKEFVICYNFALEAQLYSYKYSQTCSKGTCIKQSPAFKGHYFRSNYRQRSENLHVLSKQPVLAFP